MVAVWQDGGSEVAVRWQGDGKMVTGRWQGGGRAVAGCTSRMRGCQMWDVLRGSVQLP